MSQQNVELVRHLYESGLIDRDPEELLELATPDVEYVNPPYAVEPGVCRGLGPVAQAMRRFAEVWEESRHELQELYDRGDIVVAAVSCTFAAGEARGNLSTRRHTPGPFRRPDRPFRVGTGSRAGAQGSRLS
jgi:ketosteroid isomerase-like protein